MAKLALGKYLEENGISKNEFARILEVKSPTVRKFFKPDYDPKFSTLNKWATKLNCSVNDLIEEDSVKKRRKPKKKL